MSNIKIKTDFTRDEKLEFLAADMREMLWDYLQISGDDIAEIRIRCTRDQMILQLKESHAKAKS